MKFFIFLTLSIFLTVHCERKLRGIAPERVSLYDPNRAFACFDGSAVIPFSQVNDDYCDCNDGSDEPGTSACQNGQFACENLGYIVQYIPASRVNDGICDCCDGSDEWSGKVQCENKCIALAAQKRQEEEQLKQLKEQGFIKRKELIELGIEFKKSLESKLKDLEEQKTKTEAEKSQLEALKTQAESKSKEAKDIQDKILQEKAKEQERLEQASKAKALFEVLDSNKDSILQPDELLGHQELDILFDNDGKFTLEESVQLLDNNNNVNVEVFVASYYEKLQPHLKTEEQVVSEETPEQDEQPEGDQEEEEHVQEPVTETPKQESKYDEYTQKLIDDSEEARRKFEESERQLRDIEREISESKKKLELDLGPNGEFASMIDKCFEYEDREYVYKLCPFDRTVQKSKTGHGETTIGNWKSWNDDQDNKYMVMFFDNGLACWNGPQRSTKVIITCGTENKLTSVSEPNRCEYEMKFETPGVCEQHQDSHDEL